MGDEFISQNPRLDRLNSKYIKVNFRMIKYFYNHFTKV